MMDIFIKLKENENKGEKKKIVKRRKRITKKVLLVKKEIPKIVVPYKNKTIEIGPLNPEDIISLDKELANELVNRLGYEYFEEIYIR